MDVARQRDDRRGRLTPLAGADRAHDPHHPLQRLPERRPVLEIEPLAQLLAEHGGRRAPGALADRLVPGLEVVHPGREQQRQRRADQEVVAVAGGVLLDPAPLVLVDHAALAGVEHAPGARVDHHQPRRADVAAVAPARALDLAVGLRTELGQTEVVHEQGVPILEADRSGMAAAVQAATDADAAVLTVGDLGASSGRAPEVKAVTQSTCGCPASRKNSSKRCSRLGPPPSSSWSPGRPYALGFRRPLRRRCAGLHARRRRADRRWPECSAGT